MPIKASDLPRVLAYGDRPTARALELVKKGDVNVELKTLVEKFYSTEVTLFAPDDTGATKGEKVKVIYHPIDAKLLQEVRAAEADDLKDAADVAALLVKSLPDITREGAPVECSLELFKAMDARHPAAIVHAVLEHFKARG